MNEGLRIVGRRFTIKSVWSDILHFKIDWADSSITFFPLLPTGTGLKINLDDVKKVWYLLI